MKRSLLKPLFALWVLYILYRYKQCLHEKNIKAVMNSVEIVVRFSDINLLKLIIPTSIK